jgi:hypothetical protein
MAAKQQKTRRYLKVRRAVVGVELTLRRCYHIAHPTSATLLLAKAGTSCLSRRGGVTARAERSSVWSSVENPLRAIYGS